MSSVCETIAVLGGISGGVLGCIIGASFPLGLNVLVRASRNPGAFFTGQMTFRVEVSNLPIIIPGIIAIPGAFFAYGYYEGHKFFAGACEALNEYFESKPVLAGTVKSYECYAK